MAGTSSNPDGDRRHRRHRHVGETHRGQRATRRFQRATSIEVEFTNEFTEARDTTDPYPSSQALFERGRAPGEDDLFNDVFKKDFIMATAMKARRKMRGMRIDPYPDAILRRGLHKKEPRETADPILEDVMMYECVVLGMNHEDWNEPHAVQSSQDPELGLVLHSRSMSIPWSLTRFVEVSPVHRCRPVRPRMILG